MKSPMRLALVLLLVVGLMPADAAAVNSWGSRSQLALNGSASAVAADGATVAAVWHRGVGPVSANNTEVFVRVSTNGGTAWQPIVRLSTTPGISFDATVAVSGSTIHVAWIDLRADGKPRIHYRRSTNAGTTWSPTTRLANSTTWIIEPRLAVSGDRVHLMWADDLDFIAYGYGYSRSLDGGATWSHPSFPFGASTCGTGHDITASVKRVYAVWNGCHLMSSASLDSGGTWSPALMVEPELNRPYNPAIEATGRFVNIVWTSGTGTAEIFHRRSTDSGASFSSRQRLSKTNGAASFSVAIALEGMTVHVGWFDQKHQAVDIRTSTDRGATWGPVSLPTRDVMRSGPPPGLAVDDGAVHVTWTSAKHGRPFYRQGS